MNGNEEKKINSPHRRLGILRTVKEALIELGGRRGMILLISLVKVFFFAERICHGTHRAEESCSD